VDHTSPSLDRLPLCAFSHCSSKRPWSPSFGFFLTLVILAPQLPFLFEHITATEVFVSVRATCCRPASLHFTIFEQNQRKAYRKVLIAEDLSKEDPNLSPYPSGIFEKKRGECPKREVVLSSEGTFKLWLKYWRGSEVSIFRWRGCGGRG